MLSVASLTRIQTFTIINHPDRNKDGVDRAGRGEAMRSVILFDFDGTVYDTVEGITKCVQYALRKHGRDAELDELRCFAGPPLADMFMEKYGVDRALGEQMTREFRERYRPVGIYESRVFPEVRELLVKLRAAGKKLGLATSKPESMARKLLERENMLELFDAIAGSREDGNNNAKWQVICRAMEALEAKAEETILVGDTKYDVAGAHRVGIPCVAVGYGYAAPGELEAAGADAIVPDCAALLAYLLKEA